MRSGISLGLRAEKGREREGTNLIWSIGDADVEIR